MKFGGNRVDGKRFSQAAESGTVGIRGHQASGLGVEIEKRTNSNGLQLESFCRCCLSVFSVF